MQKGFIKYINREDNYGYIGVKDFPDFPFRATDAPPDIKAGDRVTFTTAKTGGGICVSGIQKIERDISAKPRKKKPFHAQSADTQKGEADDRVHCPGCNKFVRPRLLTERKGKIEQAHSIACTLCGETIRKIGSDQVDTKEALDDTIPFGDEKPQQTPKSTRTRTKVVYADPGEYLVPIIISIIGLVGILVTLPKP